MTSVLKSDTQRKDRGDGHVKKAENGIMHSQVKEATRSWKNQRTESPLELSEGNVALRTPGFGNSVFQNSGKMNLLF